MTVLIENYNQIAIRKRRILYSQRRAYRSIFKINYIRI